MPGMEVSPTVIKAMLEAMEIAGYSVNLEPDGGRWTASATQGGHRWQATADESYDALVALCEACGFDLEG